MPKTIEAVSSGPLKKTTTVPQPGEGRKAADIETPVKDLLNNDLFLNALIEALARRFTEHGHDLATDTTAGFMSPGDRQRISGLQASFDSHGHTVATATAPGFMSATDKTKLNGIEAGAHTVTRARVLEALGVKTERRTLPEEVYAPNEVKKFVIGMPGVTPDDPVASSQYMSNSGQFGIMYHAVDGAVEVFVRNHSATNSRTFTPGEITVMVFKL